MWKEIYLYRGEIMKITPEHLASLLTQYSENPTYGVTERDALKEAAELISKLAKDQARIDWFEKQGCIEISHILVSGNDENFKTYYCVSAYDPFVNSEEEALRAAIDAAMEQEQ